MTADGNYVVVEIHKVDIVHGRYVGFGSYFRTRLICAAVLVGKSKTFDVVGD